tara:strand:- start:3139 stop:3714 length:576 start_codon:yes stop_codon:yes gene_type:complete
MRVCNAYNAYFLVYIFSSLTKCFGYNTPQHTHNLARDNFKLVPYFAKPFINSHKLGKYERDELIQEGYIGLIFACRSYDPKYNVAISTYSSYWIKSYMKNYIRKKDKFGTPLTLDVERFVLHHTEPMAEVNLLLEFLTPFERGMLRRRYFDKVTIKQMAFEYGVSRNTMSHYLKKIRNKLQGHIMRQSSQP